jgi:alpha-mannosidase
LGSGQDTVGVLLAKGWNSLLLKVVNRTGGFGLRARFAAIRGETLDDFRLAVARPEDKTSHLHPRAGVTVGPVRLDARLAWAGDTLTAAASVPVTAWGPDTLRGVTIKLRRGRQILTVVGFGALAPGTPVTTRISAPFRALRNASLERDRIRIEAEWDGGRRRDELWVDPDALLRLVGGRLALGHMAALTREQPSTELSATLVVPPALDGLTLDLLTLGLGPRSQYRVNGSDPSWQDGLFTLCAPCRAGDTLFIAITPEPGRPLWADPVIRVREPGYAEFADGYEYALAFAGRAPAVERPDAEGWLEALGSNDYHDLCRTYGEAFAPLAAEIRRDTLLLVGNSHIDAAWLWRWEETIDVVRNTWRTSLKLGEMFPEYHFAGSSAAFYDAMDRLEPGLADSLRRAVERGDWSTVGGWWVESDLNVPSGESLVRQGLYGQRYFQRHYGRRSRIAWTPDTFGYPWTVPQILVRSGFDMFVTQKIRWNDSTEFPHVAFYWEGPDGSRVFSYNPYGYVHRLQPDRLIREVVDDRERTGGRHHVVLYGVGDHGGGPTIAMLQRAEDLSRVPTFPAVEHSDPRSALERVQSSRPAGRFPVWRDEMYLEYHRGTYTTHARVKRRNRLSEVMLQTAEALATVDTAPYPRHLIEGAWRRVLFNQFHDILPGSSIDSVYLDAHATYDTAWAMIDSVTGPSFERLRGRMDTRGGEPSVVVFNPLGWDRDGVVTVTGPDGDSVRVTVSDVPALGALVVRLPGDTMSAPESGLSEPAAGPDWIENAFLRVEIDTLTGAITRLFDKANQREALAPGGRGNVLQVFDDRPAQWDAWNISLTGERWEVTSVLRHRSFADDRQAIFQLERAWGNSSFQQRLVLGRTARYLDVHNDVEWRERRKLLKVAFALGVSADTATYEIPYGTIGRSGNPRTQAERAKFEVPGQRWADVSEADYGVSILNDSKYGWDYRGNVLRLSLLRSPIWPDSTADRGRHLFRFAVYPHVGDWRAAGTVRRAAEYNTPLLAAQEPAHPGPLGQRFSLASATPDRVQLTWVKRAEDSERLVLRLVEWHGASADARVTVHCDVAEAHAADLLEDAEESLPVNGRTLRVSLSPYEIATVLVQCAP